MLDHEQRGWPLFASQFALPFHRPSPFNTDIPSEGVGGRARPSEYGHGIAESPHLFHPPGLGCSSSEHKTRFSGSGCYWAGSCRSQTPSHPSSFLKVRRLSRSSIQRGLGLTSTGHHGTDQTLCGSGFHSGQADLLDGSRPHQMGTCFGLWKWLK